MKNAILPVPVDGDLKGLVEEVAQRTHLSEQDVMRSALRIGLPEVAKRHDNSSRPRRPLIEYLDEFAGLVKPNREMVKPSRFS